MSQGFRLCCSDCAHVSSPHGARVFLGLKTPRGPSWNVDRSLFNIFGQVASNQDHAADVPGVIY